MSKSTAERFFDKIEVITPSNCWWWSASLDKNGYGQLKVKGKVKKAHRISYKYFNGECPDNKNVLHKCDNPSCVNPDHLRLGSQADNMMDAANKGRMPRGENSYCSKLTEKEVLEILASNTKQNKLAKKYKVSPNTISLIKSGKRWSYLTRGGHCGS